MNEMGKFPVDLLGEFPFSDDPPPRDPRYRKSDNTALHTGWTVARRSVHATVFERDDRGIDRPPLEYRQ